MQAGAGRLAADPGLLREVGQFHNLPAGQRVAGGESHAVGVVEQVDQIHARRRGRVRPDDESEAARPSATSASGSSGSLSRNSTPIPGCSRRKRASAGASSPGPAVAKYRTASRPVRPARRSARAASATAT